jgi:hypothetical protein
MSDVYEASLLKPKRHRSTKADMEVFRSNLYRIVEEQKPMIVRQVYYQASVRDFVEKTEKGYIMVQRNLALMRRANDGSSLDIDPDVWLPYEWIVDNTRAPQVVYSCTDVADALDDTVRQYRRALWQDQNEHVEIWLEKDALAGVISPITERYDVRLMVARGYASISFLHEAAQHLKYVDKPTFIYHLGDYDPSGQDAAREIEDSLTRMAPGVDMTFRRLAVTPEQIREWRLPSRPTKQSDTRAVAFGDDQSVELDAIDPRRLRSLVQVAIQRHMPDDLYAKLKEQETRDREELRVMVDLAKGL